MSKITVLLVSAKEISLLLLGIIAIFKQGSYFEMLHCFKKKKIMVSIYYLQTLYMKYTISLVCVFSHLIEQLENFCLKLLTQQI